MAETQRARPLAPDSSPEDRLLHIIRESKQEADQAKRTRMQRNRRNMDAFFSKQDWSHKQKGQSKEFLPKTSQAVEQFVSFIKRALVDFGDWFSLEMPDMPGLDPEDIRRFLRCQLDTLRYAGDEREDFATLFGDGLKLGSLESLVIFKVHGAMLTDRKWMVERGVTLLDTPFGPIPQMQPRLVQQDTSQWHLQIDLVSPTDYYPDPTGRGLYEIHEVERDLAEVQALSQGENPIYDPAVVAQIDEDFRQSELDKRREGHRGQDRATAPSFRKRVVLWEYWGSVLNPDGSMQQANVLATVANEKYLIRKPEQNPFWHNQSPFVAFPLIRVPKSVWHKALMDEAVEINLALNELYNLIVDGGMASAWGVKQLRKDALDDPRQIANGIQQGMTLFVKEEFPVGQKVLEQVTTGQTPPDALNLFNLEDREFQVAAMTNDLKLGQLPPRDVKATAIVEASQGQAGLIDGIVRDIENTGMEPLLRKTWLTILQHFNQFNAQEVIRTMGERATFILARMSPAERFVTFAEGCTFKVNGLSAVLARIRDFQKLLALLEVVGSNPLLAQAWIRRMSADKTLDRLLKTLNIDPESLEADEDERQQNVQLAQQLEQGQAGGRRLPAASIPTLQEGAESPTLARDTEQLSLALGEA